MQDRPTAPELLSAVAQFLNTEIAPTLTDSRLRFRTLVAANVLQIITRELAQNPAALRAEAESLSELFLNRESIVSSENLAEHISHISGASLPPLLDLVLEQLNPQRDTTELPENIAHVNHLLCAQIRAGAADEGPFHDAVFAHVEKSIIAKLQIANPKYLERVLSEARTAQQE